MAYYLPKIARKLLNPPAIKNSIVDKTARFDIGCNITSSKVGRFSYCGEYSSLSVVEVGNFTSISSNCLIGGGRHPVEWVAMSTVFQNTGGIMRNKICRHDFQTHTTTHIGNDVWIGGGCLIKGGVSISDGAVIGMGSVVTHDVGPYEIWAGNPAKMIRKRFDDDTINKLLSIRWWDWPIETIKERADSLNNVRAFIDCWY